MTPARTLSKPASMAWKSNSSAWPFAEPFGAGRGMPGCARPPRALFWPWVRGAAGAGATALACDGLAPHAGAASEAAAAGLGGSASGACSGAADVTDVAAAGCEAVDSHTCRSLMSAPRKMIYS